MKPSEILQQAADTAERVGHCKHRMYNREYHFPKRTLTECCILGAIDHHSPDNLARKEVTTFVYQTIGQEWECHMGDWNDRPETTKEMVVDVLRRATALAVAAGQ